MKKRTVLSLLVCLLGLTMSLVWIWPRDAEYYYNRGCERLPGDNDHEGDQDGALADFNRAISLNPRFAAAYAIRARIKEMRGDLDAAIADLDRAIELNPKDYPRGYDVFNHRASLKHKKGDFSGMVADLAHATEVCPPELVRFKDAGAFGRDSTSVLRRWLRNYDRAIEQNPNFSWGYYHRGVLKHLASDLDSALADFRRCSEFPDFRLKDYAAIHIWLVRAQKGESAEANLELSKYLSTRENVTTREWEVQIAKFLLDQNSEAEFSAAVGISDAERERSQFWYYVAMKQLLSGDKAKATECFRKSRLTETRPYAVEISAHIELSLLGQ